MNSVSYTVGEHNYMYFTVTGTTLKHPCVGECQYFEGMFNRAQVAYIHHGQTAELIQHLELVSNRSVSNKQTSVHYTIHTLHLVVPVG